MVTLTTLFGTLGFAMYVDGYEAGVMSALETYYGLLFFIYVSGSLQSMLIATR